MSCSTKILLWMPALMIGAVVSLLAQTPARPLPPALRLQFARKAATFDADVQPIFQANCTGCPASHAH